MKIRLAKDKVDDPVKFIRRCGYGQLRDRRTGETSYVKRCGALLYPRFHIYFKETKQELQINLHLDQRQPSYQGVTAHSGEYEGEVVEREGARIMVAAETYLKSK